MHMHMHTCTCKCAAHQVVESGARRGETLGALWTARCCEIGSCAAEIEIDDEIEISGNFPPALPGDVPQLPPPPPSWPPGSPVTLVLALAL